MSYVPVIGLEVHLQLKTQSKIFCGCRTAFGAAPNSQVCPVCLGLPGVLPVLNRRVMDLGIRVALGLHCRIRSQLLFHRKNYFYPDLPKGYQISQYDLPLATEGWVEIPAHASPTPPAGEQRGGGERKIRIHRVHMEEDAGKLIHKEGEAVSLVDFNRCGVPLLEIVTEPDLKSPEEAHAYLKTLKAILQYLEVSDCDMEKGSLRCDANVSLKLPSPHGGEGALGTRAEIKNLNSFRAVARALSYEIRRQAELLDAGGRVEQETRLWDDVKGVTQGMRSKEYAHDYRYFPEPDLVPFAVAEEQVRQIRQTLPELPRQRAARFVAAYGLPETDALALTASQAGADYFEEAVRLAGGKAGVSGKGLANWMLGELARELNDRGLEDVRELGFAPEHLVDLLTLIGSGQISGKMAKEVFAESLRCRERPSAVVRNRGLSQVTERSVLEAAARTVIADHAEAASDYRQGKKQALKFLVGQLMARTRGAASPTVSQEVLRALLEKKP